MDYTEAREQLKDKLRDYTEAITTPDRKAGQNMYVCPLCGSGTHRGDKSTGAFSLENNRKWKCFACLKGGDIFDLIGEHEHITDHARQLLYAADLYGVTLDHASPSPAAATKPEPIKTEPLQQPEHKAPEPNKFKDYIEKCAAAADQTDYFQSRGITAETINRFKLGYDTAKEAVVIPYSSDYSYYITRSTQRKEFRKPPTEQAGQEPVYNAAALYGNQPCFICESPIDAISIMQAGGTAAAIGGTGAQKLIDEIKRAKPESTLILCFDNDSAGRKATATTAAELQTLGIKYTTAYFSLDEYSGDRKDANDLLQANEAQLKEDIRQNTKTAARKAAFVPHKVSDYLKGGFYEADIAYFKKYKTRKTGFTNIDKHLTLYPGLAALGGSASLGKSTFAVNLADNLIEAGENVLYFALEQEPIELVTKSLARRLFSRDPFSKINNIDIKNGATSAALEAVKKEYAEPAERFVIVRCNFTTTAEDIRDYVESHIRATGKRPAVFIDYLQLISAPQGFRGDIRTATDHIVKTFKTMQVDNELLVIMISNFNRNSYVVPVSYEAFKETSMIEFTCDYVWGLQLSVLEDESFYTSTGTRNGTKETTIKAKKDAIYKASTENPKQVEFVSLKSRNGKQSYKCFFKYEMPFDVFIPDENSKYEQGGLTSFLEFMEDENINFNNVPIV